MRCGDALWGKLLEKNIATFRCYGTVSPAKRVRFPHAPFKNFLKKEVLG